MDKIYQVKLKLLIWLLKSPPLRQITIDELNEKFGNELGKWFLTRIWNDSKKQTELTKFGKAVDALSLKTKNDAVNAEKVANAIEWDAAFHSQWDAAGFEFQFPRLYPDWLDVIAAVAEPFYDLWLASDSGFKMAPFGLTKDMTRDRIMKAFRPQSMGICGYCDGPLGDIGKKAEANDCEHFFPKSKWPHLAIHPANLYATCKGCNETWKLGKTPMKMVSSALWLNRQAKSHHRARSNPI